MPIRPPSPGAIVENKYRLAERVGSGGMGDVFRAESLAAGRPVAIKFLHPDLAQNIEVAQRFFQEAAAINKIRHPNVVEVVDAGTGEMGPYIVMEYLDGESVGSALTRIGRFEVDAAVGAAIPVLEALDAAHRVGVIHRDLKPENVFIALDATRSGVIVRLLDFGIAKVLDPTGPGPRTRTGVVFGTPDYLSPEQASGEGPLDGRSDLFAVGVLLYELLTGFRPFRAPTAVATAFKVVHAEAPSIAAAGVYVDARLEAIVHRLLQKEPAKRFPAAPEVIRELEKLSPDPARRVAALMRVVSTFRRPVQGPPTLESERSTISSRDPGPTLRLSAPTSQQGPHSSPGGRAADSSRAPRLLGGDGPRTLRSQSAGGFGGGTPAREPTIVTAAPRASAEPARDSAPRSPRAEALRPFPPHFVGRFQVRGPVLRSVDRAIVELFGASARDELVSRMPDAYAAELRNDSINALVAYDLEAVDAYMAHATATLLHDIGRWREVGKLAVDGELHGVVRTLLRPAVDAGGVVRRGVSTWARLFSFGTWRVSVSEGGKVTLTIGELDAVAQPLRLWIVGMIEQTTRRAVRPDLRVTVTSGDQDFTPEMVCEME